MRDSDPRHQHDSSQCMQINADAKDYNSYVNRSFVKARNSDWDRALDDALKSISIQPSLMGCISKGIVLCGKRQFEDAMKVFDIAVKQQYREELMKLLTVSVNVVRSRVA
ncbi:uncharacterized protein HD556DRAFT_1447278 [Suillus plorans]|uniref:Uncharacterized protein n=1 Tax=Suillus plorans TaxID=116603 RepID=A0A9P7DE12_9AGAM|nr:uncharacterized protein HD556DRAFT_1447278 [Suillus plorans]KAG1789004.1 hypothetical protein HD556DRAFT_1447278 [Suillus plorans]